MNDTGLLLAAVAGLGFISVVLGFVLYAVSGKGPARASSTPLMRACPACGSELKIGENILAERTGVVKEGRERIVIKGCPHCLKRPV